MEEYLCVTLFSHQDEGRAAFSVRLSSFWTRLLRNQPALYAGVFAEASAFEEKSGRLSRAYMVEAETAALLETELRNGQITYEPIDRAEVYSRYEATPPEWMQVAH